MKYFFCLYLFIYLSFVNYWAQKITFRFFRFNTQTEKCRKCNNIWMSNFLSVLETHATWYQKLMCSVHSYAITWKTCGSCFILSCPSPPFPSIWTSNPYSYSCSTHQWTVRRTYTPCYRVQTLSRICPSTIFCK